MDISSWPWVLCMFNAMIIFSISFSLKTIVPSLNWVKNIGLIGSTLSFFKGVHCSAKNLLKIFALISEIPIMLFCRSSSIKRYWHSCNKESLWWYLFNFFYQILTEKITHSVGFMTYDTCKLKSSSWWTSFLKKSKIHNFSIFAMSQTATF